MKACFYHLEFRLMFEQELISLKYLDVYFLICFNQLKLHDLDSKFSCRET